MIKLLWVGDSVANTGLARVTDTICTELHKTGKYDITVLGINYRGDPHDKPYKVYPTWQTDMLGLTRLTPLIEYIKPDIVVLFSDLWIVVNLWLPRIPESYRGKLVTYFPVDAGPYDEPSWIEGLKMFNKVCTYTKFGEKILCEAGYEGSVTILPHGVDTSTFYPTDKNVSRSILKGIELDDFIVFNGNRNQPRKRIDLTIKGFAEFSKMVEGKKPKLYLHMGIKDMGFDILRLSDRYLEKGQLLITSPKISPASGVSDEVLNHIYNSADIGLNTSGGEGWGKQYGQAPLYSNIQ